MQPQTMGPNLLSGSIILPSVRPTGSLRDFCDLCICINFQCGGPALRCLYHHTGVRRTPVGSNRYYMYVCFSISLSLCISLCIYVSLCVSMYLCLSVSLSLCLSLCSSVSLFCDNKSVACNSAHLMRLQDTGSKPLSGSIICPPFHPSSRPRAFCECCICINFLHGGQVP